MKKLSSRLAFMMAMAVCTTAFVSCSSDDEDDPKGGETTSKRIVKMTWSDGDEINITTFDYDSQGRVMKIKETEVGGKYDEASITTTYTYGGNTIFSKTQGDWNNENAHTYTLSNGRIIKDIESGGDNGTHTYAYDNNDYVILQTYVHDVDSGKIDFTWTDGNLTKYSDTRDDGSSYTYNISYSNMLWPQNWIHYWIHMDVVFEPIGAWGKMPKNLPTKSVCVSSDGYTDGWTIDYIIENGLITKTIWKDLNDPSHTEITTFEWE